MDVKISILSGYCFINSYAVLKIIQQYKTNLTLDRQCTSLIISYICWNIPLMHLNIHADWSIEMTNTRCKSKCFLWLSSYYRCESDYYFQVVLWYKIIDTLVSMISSTPYLNRFETCMWLYLEWYNTFNMYH